MAMRAQIQSTMKNVLTNLNIRLPQKGEKEEMTEEDLLFLQKIAPRGLTPGRAYNRISGRYVTILIVYGYPSYLDDLLFADLFNRPGVLATFDVTKKAKQDAISDIEGSMNELSNRYTINRKTSDNQNDEYALADIKNLHANLTRTQENIAYVTLRFVVLADSLTELDKRAEDMRKSLLEHGLQCYIPENELLAEFRGLQRSADTVSQAMPVYMTLSRQIPFYFQSHTDKHGLIFGQTLTNGLAVIDTFEIDDKKNRLSYDLLIAALKGSGKTSVLKDLMQLMVAMGNKVMTCDYENEFRKYTKKLNGNYVNPLSDGGFINMLELRWMVSARFDGDAGAPLNDEAIVRTNYTTEISRIISGFRQLFPNMDDETSDVLSEMLELTYRRKGITELTKLNELSHKDFPIMQDLLDTVRDTLYVTLDTDEPKYRPSLSAHRREMLERLETSLKTVAEGAYKQVFNGYTSVDIENDNLVVFDISLIREMEYRIYNAYIFNIFSLMWSEVYKNRELNDGVPEDESRKCICVIPEAHIILNPNNPYGVNFMDKLVRRDRKYLGALWFDSQSISDYDPSDSSGIGQKIRDIFGLVQYKVLMHQDGSKLDAVEKLIPEFTRSEIESTTNFKKGEMLVSMGGKNKIHCTRYIPPEDFEYFGGGR